MLSKTPLVGAPYRMANALNLIPNVTVELFTFSDYPNHLKGIFEIGELIHDLNFLDAKCFDLVWIHNSIPDELWADFECKFRNIRKVVQFHSGTHEGPLNFVDLHEYPYNIFDQQLVVAQAWARMYPDATMIPNIVPKIQPLQDMTGSYLRILYTPSHGGGGRFGFKDGKATSQSLKLFEDDLSSIYRKNIEIVIPDKPIKQTELMFLRSQCHVSIDECFSGGFHQVSLEALATGGVAVCGADIFSLLAYSNAIEADEIPPFIISRETKDLYSKLVELALNEDHFFDSIILSRSYSEKYLGPERLAKIVYRRLWEL